MGRPEVSLGRSLFFLISYFLFIIPNSWFPQLPSSIFLHESISTLFEVNLIFTGGI